MLRIKKRDGGIEDFDITKIENAIEKAFMAEHKFYNHDIIEMLALRTTAEFNKKVVNETIGIVNNIKIYVILRKQTLTIKMSLITI